MNVGRIIATHVGTGAEALTKAVGGQYVAKNSIIGKHVGTSMDTLVKAVVPESQVKSGGIIAEHVGTSMKKLKAMFSPNVRVVENAVPVIKYQAVA